MNTSENITKVKAGKKEKLIPKKEFSGLRMANEEVIDNLIVQSELFV
jgi:hypothetical protein